MVYTWKLRCSDIGFMGFYAGNVYWPGHSPGHCQAPLALHCVGACLPAAHVYPRGASDDARWGPLWGRDGLLHAHMQASGRPQSAAPKQSTAQEQVPTQQQPPFRQATRPGSETLNTIFFCGDQLRSKIEREGLDSFLTKLLS
jgi:hypothetical protein